MGREPLLGIVIGKKGTGKTVETIRRIRKSAAGDPLAGTPRRKALIIDSNNEFSDREKYPDIFSLHLKDVATYSAHPNVEIRRIPPFLPNGEEMTPDQKAWAVDYVLKNFRNGIVLLEDINSYIGDYMPMDVVGVILSQRHKGIDTILHYHSFGRVQKKIWPHVNWIRMHRSNDNVSMNKQKFPDKYECFRIAEIIVNTKFDAGDQYFYLYIDNDHEKIHARISDQERDQAIMDYIGMHPDKVNELLYMRNESGGKVHTWQSALQATKQRLVSTYFLEKKQ